ncbi:MAG: chorismate synthase, partial [Myxococcota bacterium]
MGNSFGRAFRITTFGESHGGAVGVVIDGCPPRMRLDLGRIQRELDRRRPGGSRLSSQRKESDAVEVLSGLQDGVTLGTPIALVIRNEDADPAAYAATAHLYRPSHADFTWDSKFGIRA